MTKRPSVYTLSATGRALTWRQWKRLTGGASVLPDLARHEVGKALDRPEGLRNWDAVTLGQMADAYAPAGRALARFAVEHLDRRDLAEVEMTRNPLDGTPLTHDYDRGYWTRYTGGERELGASKAWLQGYQTCHQELSESAVP